MIGGPSMMCRARRLKWAVAAVSLLGFAASPDIALAGSARDYLNAPIDSWFAFYNLDHSRFVTPADGIDATSNVRSNVLSQSVVLTRTMDYWGRTGGFSVILPYRHLESSSDAFRISAQGPSDLGFLWQINLFGGPALTREQFRYFVPQTFSSFHLVVLTPLGRYDATSPLNPGSNRWTFVPTINYSYTPDRGWTWLEAYFTAKMFTDNTDYRVGGASNLAQKPLFVIEGHASRNLAKGFWVSADAYYNVGGETRIDGVAQSNAANTLRLGGGMGVNAWTGGDVMLNYERVVAKPAAQPDAQTFRLTIRQFW